MAILSNTEICINGKFLHHFKKFNLQQEIGDHHTLDLYCQLANIQSFCRYLEEEIEELLGQVLTVEIKSFLRTNYHGELKFKGIIVGVKIRKGMAASEGDYVILKVKSTTILAEDGPHYTSYNDKTFVDIINETFQNYDASKLSINTNPSSLNSDSIVYTVQYNESCFEFAKRLSARNGEWMYYDGEALVFGIDSNNDEELSMFQGRDLVDFSTSLDPIPHNYNFYTNDYNTNEIHESGTSAINNPNEGTLGIINESANDIYPNETRIWLNLSDDNNSRNRLDHFVELQNNAIQTNQIRVSGNSVNPGVSLGKLIKINQTNYRVTHVNHTCTNHGQYENFFEAIVASPNACPNTNVLDFPKAQSQTAIVLENHDPDGMGRVKVQFPWQRQQGLTTPWIRSISPSASRGQGFFFAHEVDDEVIVDFEGGNAECPYVMGGVYNSNAAPPSGSSNSGNHIKMLQSRSGSFLKLNDEDGSITLQDKSGSSIVLDGSGNITISASKSITVNAGEDIQTTSGNDTKIEAGKELEINSADKATLKSAKDLLIEGGKGITIKDKVKIDIQAKKVTAKGEVGLKLEGKIVDIKGDVATNVKGTMLNLNC